MVSLNPSSVTRSVADTAVRNSLTAVFIFGIDSRMLPLMSTASTRSSATFSDEKCVIACERPSS